MSSKINVAWKKVEVLLAKNVLAPLQVIAAAWAVDRGSQKNTHGSRMTTLVISNKEMSDIMKCVQALEDSGVLLKDITKKIENKKKEQKGTFLRMGL